MSKTDKAGFTSRLEVSPQPDGRRWYLLRRFKYDRHKKGSGDTITVPAGFVTDFASTPVSIWWLIPPWGVYGKAAIVHDYLYQNHGYDTYVDRVPVGFKLVSRETADRIFWEAMGVLEVASWRRTLMFWAVRIFGLFSWKSGPKRLKLTEAECEDRKRPGD